MTPLAPPRRFRKKPVEIEALRWDGRDCAPLIEFVGESLGELVPGRYAEILTLEGGMFASPGDWIIRGVVGEFYPCKPDIFALTYEPVAS